MIIKQTLDIKKAPVKKAPKKDQYRCLRPKGKHKTYRFQEYLIKNGAWTTISNPEVEAFNKLVLDGTLSSADTKNRLDAIKRAWYAKRDKDITIPLLMSGNAKVLQEFLASYYTEAKRTRLMPGSYDAEVRYLQAALIGLGNVAIEGPVEDIQRQIDRVFKDRPSIHKRRTGSINRLRKHLGLKPIEHLRVKKEEVVYLRKASVDHLVNETDGVAQILIAVAFYTGLRKGEIFGLEERDLHEDVLVVRQQHGPRSNFRLPKNQKIRKAYIIPGGEEWVKRWLKIKDTVSIHFKISEICRKKANIRFHDLRHSYAVYLISNGASLESVAKSLGHSKETCERYYDTHVLTTDAISLLRLSIKKTA